MAADTIGWLERVTMSLLLLLRNIFRGPVPPAAGAIELAASYTTVIDLGASFTPTVDLNASVEA